VRRILAVDHHPVVRPDELVGTFGVRVERGEVPVAAPRVQHRRPRLAARVEATRRNLHQRACHGAHVIWLYSALAWSPEKVHFVCLWNGEGGDGPGGTAHLYQEVQERTGQVYWLDTSKLW